MSNYYRTAAVLTSLMLLFFWQARVASGLSAPQNDVAVVHVLPEQPRQGQTMILQVQLPPGQSPPAVTFEGKSIKLYAVPGTTRFRALVAVPALMPPGNHKLVVGKETQVVHVASGAFGVQSIRLPKEKDNFIASAGEEEAVDKAKQTASADQLWTGVFHPPSKARISTQFGLRRRVNGRLLPDYFHSGLDYAAAQGTPVAACQAGRVILAHTGWRLHGNIVALDHGQGVVSFYLHLSKVLVREGQDVQLGEVIGKVGSTGRATGPHLHFSLYVNGEATDPRDWFKPTMPLFQTDAEQSART